jgi:hypothetical protein
MGGRRNIVRDLLVVFLVDIFFSIMRHVNKNEYFLDNKAASAVESKPRVWLGG